MLFQDLATYFYKLESTSSRLQMTEILADLFNKTSADEINEVVYLLQGRVVPIYEKLDFILAEKLVYKAIVLSFSLNEREVKKKFDEIGDLGKIAEIYRKTANILFQSETDLTISQVFKRLYDLCLLTGTGSQESRLGVIAELLQQLDPLSARYLVRILTDNLRLGFSDMTILDALSWLINKDKLNRPTIEKAFNVRPDLGWIAKNIKQFGIQALEIVKPQIGVPILMAKAERVANPEEIIEKIGKCSIEPKYDGFRLQFHYQKKDNDLLVKIYSRGLDDVTLMYPDLVSAMKKELDVNEIIFEGEAIGYDREKNSYLPFQETVQRKRKYQITEKSQEIPLKVFAFDLLYLNSVSYIDKPYLERKNQLSKIIQIKESILLTEEKEVNTAIEIENMFSQAIKEGLEGIMAKKLTGTYQAGARGWNWIKFKHSYDQKMVDTLDCLVMGYDYGQGKRTNFGLGAFLVGVYDKRLQQYVTVAKIGTGLTDNEWKELFELCKKRTTSNKPEQYAINKQLKVDVWVTPSIVVEIRADEITRSPMHSAGQDKTGVGFALRFPRLEKFRSDISSTDVTTVDELIRLYDLQKRVEL